jgi:hypothetical protein
MYLNESILRTLYFSLRYVLELEFKNVQSISDRSIARITQAEFFRYFRVVGKLNWLIIGKKRLHSILVLLIQ